MSADITQNHSGSGDNIAGNKVVQEAITPNEIQGSIRALLKSLSHRRICEAKIHLGDLESTSNLNSESQNVIKILSLLIHLADGSPPPDAYDMLITLRKRFSNELCADICNAVLIRLDVVNNKEDNARDRYKKIKDTGCYTQELFYELLATNEELAEFYRNKKLELAENEVCGLVRGLLRIGSHSLCMDASQYLEESFPSFNSKVLRLQANVNLINESIKNRHYWSIESTTRTQLLSLCDNISASFVECRGEDVRIINIAASLFEYVLGDHEVLANTCREYIAQIKKLRPDIEEQIRYMYEKSPENLTGLSYKIARSSRDHLFGKNIVDDITKSSTISSEDSTILSYVANSSTLREWLSKGGSVSSGNNLEKDFSLIELEILACDSKSIKSIEDVKVSVEAFLQKQENQIANINPYRILKVSENLLRLSLTSLVIKLLEKIIPVNDLWSSPIVKCYLEALLSSQQLKLLDSLLEKIHVDNKDAFIWNIRAHQLDMRHETNGAIQAARKALEINDLSAEGWVFLLYLHQKNKTEFNLFGDFFNEIPDAVFSSPSDSGFRLLTGMLMNGSSEKAEYYAVEWFIRDPDRYATPVTNFYLSGMLNEDANIKGSVVCEKTKNSFRGVRYLNNGKVYEKLIVSDSTPSHSCLINVLAPLGKLLSTMSVGDTEVMGMQEIKLLEIKSVGIAVFHIATELRQAMNDGGDQFHYFDLPENPSEMIEELKRKLSITNRKSNELYSDPGIPLFVKGNFENAHDPFMSALKHLTDKDSFKHPLPSFGEENPQKVILDTYSIAYLSLTGLVEPIMNSSVEIIITVETKSFLEEWINNVNRSDYLSIAISKDGHLIRTTANDMARETAGIQKSIKLIISGAKVGKPTLCDFPMDIIRVQSMLDLSVYSSMKLSISNRLTWFCMDEVFAKLADVSSYRVVNLQVFLATLTRNLPISKKQEGLYLHATANLPYPLTYDDLIELSKSGDDHAHYFLAEIMNKYPDLFRNLDLAISFSSIILSAVLFRAYLTGEFRGGPRLYNPRNNGYAERVFNVCCQLTIQCSSEKTAEQKIATLIYELLHHFKYVEFIREIIKVISSMFIAGHFMSFSAINVHLKSLQG